ncbi:MAG: hypothetical protein ACEY3L_08495 [Wolbachia sp.]
MSKFMSCEEESLVYRKKIRTYSKRLVTALSTALFIGYIATLVFNISGLSVHSAALSITLSAISLGLNSWSRTDHFRKCELNKQLGVENSPGQKKLTKIYLDIVSSVSFLIGGIASMSLFESSVIYFVSTPFFILGCAIMATNIIRTMISKPQIEENNNVKGGHPGHPGNSEAVRT